MTRHIEFEFSTKEDITYWNDIEDFEFELKNPLTEDDVKEIISDYLSEAVWTKLFDKIKIKKIWYEED